MASLEELQQAYNIILQEHNTLRAHIDNVRHPYEERIRKGPEYLSLCDRLSRLIRRIKEAGYDVTHEEIIQGFDDDK